MTKSALFLICLASGVLSALSEFQYKGRLIYVQKPFQIRKGENKEVAKIFFFYDSQCGKSISKKDNLTSYHVKNPILGKYLRLMSEICMN